MSRRLKIHRIYLKFKLKFIINIRDKVTIAIPIQAFIDKNSFINRFPVNAAKRGDKASMERVFLVPIRFSDFK